MRLNAETSGMARWHEWTCKLNRLICRHVRRLFLAHYWLETRRSRVVAACLGIHASEALRSNKLESLGEVKKHRTIDWQALIEKWCHDRPDAGTLDQPESRQTGRVFSVTWSIGRGVFHLAECLWRSLPERVVAWAASHQLSLIQSSVAGEPCDRHRHRRGLVRMSRRFRHAPQ